MPLSSNPSDKIRVPLCDPSQHEESRTNLLRREELKKFFCISLYPTFELIPMSPTHRGVESGHLKMLFDVKG